MSTKKSIQVRMASAVSAAPLRVAFYPGSSAESIERAILSALGQTLPEGGRVLCRDADGDVVALSDSLPDGLVLSVELSRPDAKPSEPAAAATATIPGPRPLPIIGNLADLRRGNFLSAAEDLLHKFGDFVVLKLPGRTVYLTRDPEVIKDMLSRPQDFPKRTIGDRSPLSHLRTYSVGDGLFTAEDDEEIWHVAHRILLPTMGTSALKQYYPKMLEIADVLLAQLGRLRAAEPFLATDLMTRMTFETIAYTGFNTRFHCLESNEAIPFVDAMVEVLRDAMQAPMSVLPASFHPLAAHRRERANTVLAGTVDRIIAERKQALERGEPVPNDILQTMLTARDRMTGKRLPDENIRHQLITFLIAGHETTSGLLSYALYLISRHPQIEAALCAEVDRVLGRDFSYRPTYQDIERLDYVGRVLKETLRLYPTAPAFNKVVDRDTVLAGMYPVSKGQRVVTLLTALHRHPQHWGPDAERFDPDRFLPESIAARHPNVYHPFGLGMRSCIGFQFALLEARLVLALLYQRYRPRLHDPNYPLVHVQTLTIKPKDLLLVLEPRSEDKGAFPAPEQRDVPVAAQPGKTTSGPPFYVLYGSNMGTCQDLAQGIARHATARGFAPVLADLDAFSSLDALAKIGAAPLVIVSSTYNGTPPDNAQKFAALISDPALAGSPLQGLQYAVLGCGNKQWRTTFQKFPKHVHARLRALGATPFMPLGSCDADGDLEAAADAWQKQLFRTVPTILSAASPPPPAPETSPLLYSVEVVNFAGTQARAVLPNKFPLQDEARLGVILRNEELQSSLSDRSTRHIEIELPEGVTYAAGDHLGVFPENPHDLVAAVATRCGVRSSDVVVLHELSPLQSTIARDSAHLPTGVPITVHDLLTYHIDLSGPLSRKELRALAEGCPCPPEQKQLLDLASEASFGRDVLGQKLTLLDVLLRFASVPCPLPLLLSLRPLLKPRYYSISSSPRMLARACSITVGVHNFNGPHEARREGLCSHYLLHCPAGSQIRMLVKDTRSTFRLPVDAKTPVLLIGPGTGLAPMRGFIQERAAQRQAGEIVGKTVLFFGCRRPDHDFIYRYELEQHLKDGSLDQLYIAFSRQPDHPRMYVQDLLRQHADRVLALLDQGAAIYVCGDARKMAADVQHMLAQLVAKARGCSLADADAVLEGWKSEGRYLQDVWAS
ncbi:MAG: cytochrome P450 [Myxococcales bacterium]|nr:cytochrome P450 [Myxococcales bacterium]